MSPNTPDPTSPTRCDARARALPDGRAEAPLSSPVPAAPAAASPVASATPTRCPKCTWAVPDRATTCAACGIVFAKYDAAQRKLAERRSATPAATPSPFGAASAPPSFDGSPLPLPPSPIPLPFSSVELELDRPPPRSPRQASSSSWPEPESAPAWPSDPLHQPAIEERGAFTLAIDALLGAFRRTPALIALQLLPIAATVVAVAFAIAQLSVAMRGNAGGGLIAAVVAGLVVVCWLMCASLAAAMRVVDGELRGAELSLGDAVSAGLAAGVRVFFVGTATSVLTLAAPFALAVATKGSSVGAPVLGGLVAAFVAFHLSLAFAAAVVDGYDVTTALSESWRRVASDRLGVARAFGAWTLVSLAINAGLAAIAAIAAIAVIPVIGWVVAAVGNIVVAGASLGMTAAVYRAR